jgi:hypothetical protein
MKRKAEVVFGLATGLLGLAYTLSLYRRIQEPGDAAYANIGFFGSEFSVIVALFLIPSLLVAFGSYFHGVQGLKLGRSSADRRCGDFDSAIFPLCQNTFADLLAWAALADPAGGAVERILS